jgi:hypothetical protein
MSEDSENNLLYFESASMRELYDCMTEWQVANRKHLLSVCIQQDRGLFCCIAVSGPTEVIITDSEGTQASVHRGNFAYQNCLKVFAIRDR